MLTKRKNFFGGSFCSSLPLLLNLFSILLAGAAFAFAIQPHIAASPADTLATTDTAPTFISDIECHDFTRLKQQLETGGVIQFDCQSIVPITETIHIRQSTTLIGHDEAGYGVVTTMLSGMHQSNTLFMVENQAQLTLENVSIANSGGIVFDVAHGGQLTLRDCEVMGHNLLRKNNATNGIIVNAGTLTIDDCTFNHNFSFGAGAVLTNQSEGQAHIIDSTFSNSTIVNTQTYIGSAIVNYGTLDMTDSLLSGNSGGTAFANISGTATLTGVAMVNNTHKGAGGAIFNNVDAEITLIGARIMFNSASFGAGFYNLGEMTLLDTYLELNKNNCYNAGILHDEHGTCKVNSDVLKN